MFRDQFAGAHAIERKRIAPTPEHVMRLHRLERPLRWPNDLEGQIQGAVTNIQRYPDYSAFLNKLSAFYGGLSHVVLGMGIEGLIRDLFMLLVGKGMGVVYTYPTCAMFDVYCEVFGAQAQRVKVDPDKPLSTYDLVNALRTNTRLLLLPNPGQPVDVVYSPEQLSFLAHECERNRTVLAIDEAYYGFGAPTFIREAALHPNVVVLRTFSKFFGAAGIRIGFATGAPDIVKALDGVRMSGEVAGPSMAIASVLLDNFDLLCAEARKTTDGRDWLVDRITDLGFRTRGKNANHVLIDCGSDEYMRRIAMGLEERALRVKHSFPAPLDRHLLVTAGPRAVMRLFYDAFAEIVS